MNLKLKTNYLIKIDYCNLQILIINMMHSNMFEKQLNNEEIKFYKKFIKHMPQHNINCFVQELQNEVPTELYILNLMGILNSFRLEKIDILSERYIHFFIYCSLTILFYSKKHLEFNMNHFSNIHKQILYIFEHYENKDVEKFKIIYSTFGYLLNEVYHGYTKYGIIWYYAQKEYNEKLKF